MTTASPAAIALPEEPSPPRGQGAHQAEGFLFLVKGDIMTSEPCPKIGENPVFTSLKPVYITSCHYNVRLKLYPSPNGEVRPVELLALSRPAYNPEGWELVGRDALPPPLAAGEEGEPPQQQRSPADERRSKRRSRAAVWDYVQCNPELDTFITLTLSARSVDRYDYSAIVALLRGWLSNRIGERRPPIPRKSIHNFGTETTAFSCLLGGKHLVFAVCKVPNAVPLSCGLRRKNRVPNRRFVRRRQ